jgi:ketosteroid isomerase-like protein
MSEENVEVVRQAFDAWNRGDHEALLRMWGRGRGVLFLRAQLEGRAYRGPDGLREFIDELADEWTDVRFEVDEFRDAGERMVGSGRFRARGRASGVDINVPLGVVGVVRSGRIVYARFFSDPSEALEAAGLSE